MFKNVEFSWNLLRNIFAQILKGNSLVRVLIHHSLNDICLSGRILDLGSGSKAPSYVRFLRLRQPYKITHSDLLKAKGMAKINLELPFNLRSNSIDVVTCFNTLEHVFSYDNVFSEAHRILVKGGMFVGSTPLVAGYHPAPDDFFRYTHKALIRIGQNVGFCCDMIVFLGFGPFAAAYSFLHSILPRAIRPFVACTGILMDLLLDKFSTQYRMRYALGYLFVFVKK
ncbi:MAG: methyltransferase domain-containing protein [Candidatus Woesearchaeota archaeon]